MMLELMPKLLKDKRIDILTMTFIFIQKLKMFEGPLFWEALGCGLLGLCLKMALVFTIFWEGKAAQQNLIY